MRHRVIFTVLEGLVNREPSSELLAEAILEELCSALDERVAPPVLLVEQVAPAYSSKRTMGRHFPAM